MNQHADWPLYEKGAKTMFKTKVLFLCTHNSCRSQMAEGILRHIAGERFEVASAGAQATRVDPDAICVMKEIGIDISTHRSKDASELLKRNGSRAPCGVPARAGRDRAASRRVCCQGIVKA